MIALLLMLAVPPMVVIDEQDVVREEAPPHGAIGMGSGCLESAFVRNTKTN